ncbi:MAG: fluoride efflux transporter CrcB [Spirochaetota bacterium]
MDKIVYIALGGSIGAVSRYLVSAASQKYLSSIAPWGTFIVNVSGCFIIGFLWSFVEERIISPNVRLFLFTGVLGGYTTFSSFGLETFNLLRDGEMRLGVMNVLMSVVLGIGCVFLGYVLGRVMIKAVR